MHGDYDVDGICATALAVLCLRDLGADVGWHLPSRFEEGYGLSGETLRAPRRRGVRAGAHGRLRHHRRRRRWPTQAPRPRGHRHRPPPAGRRRCPSARSSPRGPPSTRSRSSAARASSTSSRRPSAAPGLDRHLDLVALATIADVVPLVDENRAARDRRAAAARAGTSGRASRALMRTAQRRPGRRRRGCGRLPSRAADQRRRAALPPGGGARAPAHRRPATRQAGSRSGSRS